MDRFRSKADAAKSERTAFSDIIGQSCCAHPAVKLELSVTAVFAAFKSEARGTTKWISLAEYHSVISFPSHHPPEKKHHGLPTVILASIRHRCDGVE